MFDTVAAVLVLDRDLDRGLFLGQSVQIPFEDAMPRVRMWRSARKGSATYQPHVHWWPQRRMLRVEFSIPKMAQLPAMANVTTADVSLAIQSVDVFLERIFGKMPSVWDWRCVRVDYSWNWQVGEHVRSYLAVVRGLTMGRAQRQEHGTSVYFEQKQRVVKFYDKSQQALLADGVLRFEVSHFGRAVKNIALAFDGKRSVYDMLKVSRARFSMSRVFELLGLGNADVYESSHALHALVRANFKRPTAAYGALMLIREHGANARRDGLLGEAIITVGLRASVSVGCWH